ncbi:hypothetical protein [Flavobacterium sp.]|uniref:hypothetical protein n=1 Tax=Flavobacterium sp. TaxID=239 RepID=UPI003750DF43
MKKLFLSAIFLVAFSSVSIANTIANDDLEKENVTVISLVADNCTKVAQLAYNLAISEGANHPTAVAYSNIAYNNCKKSISAE